MQTIVKYMSRYALKKGDSKAVFIEDVPRGLKCDCYCSTCGEDLVAIQGAVYSWHFRHNAEGSTCSGCGETVLHQRAKEVLKNGASILTSQRGEIFYSEPVLEQVLMHKYRPDVTAVHKGVPIYFEVAVHHPIEEEKQKYLRGGGHRFVEINLAQWIGQEPTQEELEFAVLRDVENKIVFWGGQFVEDVKLDNNSLMSKVKSLAVALFVALAGWLLWDWAKSKGNQMRGKHKRFK